MTSRRVFALCCAAMGVLLATAANADAAPATETPAAAAAAGPAAAAEAAPISGMKSLGHDRYQIGTILVEKNLRRLTVAGRVLQLGVPLEYLVVSPHGLKGYESLLEIGASGSEFNLACILLGLDASRSTPPGMQYSREPIAGQPVAFRIYWQDGAKRHEVGVLAALYADATQIPNVEDTWIYTGSAINDYTKHYASDETGVLVGFVRDASAVVSHRTGLGIGNYGSVSGNKSLLPPVGGPVTLVMQVLPDAPLAPSKVAAKK